jgi:hypothetical protein
VHGEIGPAVRNRDLDVARGRCHVAEVGQRRLDFHLFSSWLKPYGAEHQIEASYELVPGIEDDFD